ncbi:hypothetical protein LN042_31875 [Kitasatospora sp. RB6PN24]|uniref:hypothetical protein n=1 Tax=Kitasatospora humi TaxID=2893891 RepID=UPI001E543F8E|nr:hypothetical protein [Kitasatospora humi]MCC9311611.1 hypothetical protein [Kitasatospora humi]
MGTLLLVWCAGLASALGIGAVRGTASNILVGGGGIAGLLLLVVLGFGCALQVVAVVVMRALVLRHRGTRKGAGLAPVGVFALGAAGMVALNLVLVSGPYLLLPFGPVSIALLCLPYPLAFALVEVRGRAAAARIAAAALALAAGAPTLHAVQERLAARAWLSEHAGLDHALVQAVDWPGGEQGPFTVGPYGVRTTVFFQDSDIDGGDDGVVTVAPATTDPCALPATIAAYDTTPERDEEPVDGGTNRPVTSCARDGADAWKLSGNGLAGYALRRNGVLVIVCVDSDHRTDDDLPAIARSLHPLNAHQLWPHLSLGWAAAATWFAM